MCFSEVLKSLKQSGMEVSPMQIRWAITTGKVPRPPLDGSLRFNFSAQHLEKLRSYFGKSKSSRRSHVLAEN